VRVPPVSAVRGSIPCKGLAEGDGTRGGRSRGKKENETITVTVPVRGPLTHLSVQSRSQ